MLNSTETNTIEYKREYSDTILKDVIGFLNYSMGGHIYVGIENDGTVYGINNADEIQLKIINVIRDSIQPSTLGLFDVLVEQKEAKNILHIIISSGNEKPYYIKSKGMTPQGCFLRVGSSSQQMTDNQISELYTKRTRNTLKNIVSHHQDLTFEQLKIYYQEKGLTLNNNFAKNLDLLTDDGKYNYIAYLLADKNATSIKVAKYWGTDKLKLREYKEYGYCSLIKATKAVLEKLDVENAVSTNVTYSGREERPLWNTDAVKEAVINFIVHNDYTREVPPLFEIYSDRLEITSYGGLVEGLSKEEFFSGVSMPRNRELMRIFKDLDLVVENGEMLVVAGRNGAGKSTLLRMLAGVDWTSDGEIIPGAGVKIGYFSQDNAETICGTESILDYIESRAPTELIPKVRDMLGSFLFRGDDVFKPLNVLSGGEKSRIALLQLLLSPNNLLILDEPTNHLDMHSKDVLMNALKDFGGTVIFVSHDRGFIEGLATRVLELKPGQHREFPGDYKYYMERMEAEALGQVEAPGAKEKPVLEPVKSEGKRSWEEQKRLDAERRKAERAVAKIEEEISKTEEEKSVLEAKLSLPEVYSNGAKAKEIQTKINEIAMRLEKLTEDWESAMENLCVNWLKKLKF